MKHGKIIVLSAPSRTGKDAVLSGLSPAVKALFTRITTYTTRPKRTSEKDGMDYHFVSADGFRKLVRTDALLEWATFSRYWYGTPKAPVLATLRQGKNVLLKIEVEGGTNIKRQYPKKTVAIFLEPGSLEDLKRRWQQGHFSAEQRRLRLAQAKQELEHKKHYDHVITNVDGKLPETIRAMETLIQKILGVRRRGRS